MVIDGCRLIQALLMILLFSRCRLLMVVSSRISHDLRSKGFISHHYSHHQRLEDLIVLVIVIDLWPWGVRDQKQMALSNVNGVAHRLLAVTTGWPWEIQKAVPIVPSLVSFKHGWPSLMFASTMPRFGHATRVAPEYVFSRGKPPQSFPQTFDAISLRETTHRGAPTIP